MKFFNINRLSKNGKRWLLVFLAMAATFTTALALYDVLRSGPARPSVLPAPHFKKSDLSAMLEGMSRRAGELAMDEELADFVQQVGRLNLLEADADQSGSPEHHALMAQVESSAALLASRRSQDYLRLGDRLALHFYNAFVPALEELRQGGTSEQFAHSAAFRELGFSGGAFWRRAVSSGLISSDGQIGAPVQLVAVLFRMRWRQWGRFEPLLGFSSVERALFDYFIAAFSPSATLERRLGALEQLGIYDPEYDAVAAGVWLMQQERAGKKLVGKND